MVLDRVRVGAALLLLACLALPAYTCDGHVGPDGTKVTAIPGDADSASSHAARIPHYPLEGPRGSLWLTVLAFSWPVPFFIYRYRRAPARVARWVLWLQPMVALPSGFFILTMALMGRPAYGTYLALAADAVLLADGVAEAWTTREVPL